MFVPDTITIRKLKDQTKLETPLSIKLMGLGMSFFSYLIIFANIQKPSPSQGLMIVVACIFLVFGIYFVAKDKQVFISSNNKIIIIKDSFFLINLKITKLDFSKIQDIFSEDRSLGQTLQAKYRLFIKSADIDYSLGIVNHKKKEEKIIQFLKNSIQ